MIFIRHFDALYLGRMGWLIGVLVAAALDEYLSGFPYQISKNTKKVGV